MFFGIIKNFSKAHCQHEMDEWIETMKIFVQCTMDNSRPAAYCTKCIDKYVPFLQSYKIFAEKKDDFVNNCTDYWMGHDALDVVGKTYRYTMDLWDNAFCSSEC